MPSSVRIQFKGLPQLQRRLEAIEDLGPLMRDLGLSAIGHQKRRAAVKTGNMRRQIHLGRVTARSVETIAGADYSGHVEYGTRPHEIRARNARALRWKVPGGYRYATRVRHPGTKAQPFMVPGAEDAIGDAKLRDGVIDRWNRAA